MDKQLLLDWRQEADRLRRRQSYGRRVRVIGLGGAIGIDLVLLLSSFFFLEVQRGVSIFRLAVVAAMGLAVLLFGQGLIVSAWLKLRRRMVCPHCHALLAYRLVDQPPYIQATLLDYDSDTMERCPFCREQLATDAVPAEQRA